MVDIECEAKRKENSFYVLLDNVAYGPLCRIKYEFALASLTVEQNPCCAGERREFECSFHDFLSFGLTLLILPCCFCSAELSDDVQMYNMNIKYSGNTNVIFISGNAG
jgi:hypothetical protein